MTISPATKLTAIFGHPVTHSLSPFLHNAVYEKEGIDAVMLAFGNPSVEPLIAAMRALPIHLAAVTMPHKQTLMPLIDEVDEDAKRIGSVNTIINRDGKLIGYNTDSLGVARALDGTPLKGADALVVGAGGAARTVVYQLVKEGARVFVMNRDEKQAEELCAAFGSTYITSDAAASKHFGVVVNATPIGMKPAVDAMPVPESFIQPGSAVFDLVYSPLETKLLATAKQKGAKAISGLTMFLAQGLEQERLWLGRDIAQGPYEKLLEEHVRARGE